MMLTAPHEVHWIACSLLAAVSLATCIGYVLRRRRPASPVIANLNDRILSWWAIILAGVGALLAGRIALILLFAFVSAAALREFMIQTRLIQTNRVSAFLCFLVALPVQYLLIALDASVPFLIWIPLFGFLALPVFSAFFSRTEEFIERSAATLLGLMVCVYGISHIPALMMLRRTGYEDRTPLLVVFIVVIAQAGDILQYVWGKLLGKHPIAPLLSPSKTVEGLLGGVLSAIAVGVLLSPVTPFSKAQSALMACVVAIFGFLGGLVISAMKRDLGIKDWSGFIRGHGGILDRLDSLCFSGPVFFHLTKYLFTQG
jgi:phosphatidate cytidylyltransferase